MGMVYHQVHTLVVSVGIRSIKKPLPWARKGTYPSAAYVTTRSTIAPNWAPLIRQDRQPVLSRAPLEFSQHAPRPGPDSKSASRVAGNPKAALSTSIANGLNPTRLQPVSPHDETLLSTTTTRWPASPTPIDSSSELTTTTGPQQTPREV